jgi:hypothetical protein
MESTEAEEAGPGEATVATLAATTKRKKLFFFFLL